MPADANWATLTNWVGGAAPGQSTGAITNDVATFNTALSGGTLGGVGNPIVLDATRSIGGITFDTANVGAYVIGSNAGSALILSNIGFGPGTHVIQMTSAVTNSQVIAAPIKFVAPSSTNGSFGFVNNSSSSAVTLTLSGTMTNTVARPSVVVLDGANTGSNTISGNISFTGATQGAPYLVKRGAGTWILSGTNAFTGTPMTDTTGNAGIQVLDGVLSVQNNAALGTSGTANQLQVWIGNKSATYVYNGVLTNTFSSTLGGGTLELAGGITLDNGLSLNLSNGGTIRSSGSNTTNGRINLSAAAAVSATISTVNASDVFTIGNGANDFTGGAADTVTHIAGPGSVVIMQASTNYLGTISIDAGVLRNGSSTNGLGSAGVVTFGSGSTGKLQLGNNLGLTNLTTTAGTPTAGIVETGVVGTQTLTLTTATSSTFAGTLQNGTGTLALTKAGASTLTLSGNSNTYSGNTVVSGGVLNVTNTSGSATGTSAVALNGGTLTGAGIITGTVTAAAAGIITPGTVTAGSAGSGVLTLGNLTLANGTTINYGLVAGNATANYISTGILTLPGSGTVVLDLYTPGTNTAFAAAGTYDLFQYTTLAGGPLSGAFSFGTSIAGYTPTFGTSGGYVQLTLTAAGVIGSWTNGNATGNWNEAGNWSGGIPSSAGDSAVFASAPGTVTLNANKTVGGLTFNNASAYTIVGGNTLTLDNSGSGVVIAVAIGAHSISTAVAFNDNVTVTPDVGTQLTIGGNISQVSGTRSLTKTGTGTLTLSGSNSYSGGTNVSNGVLSFNSITALGAGTTLNLGANTTNGTLRYASGNTADVSSLTVTINAGGGTLDTNGNDVLLANAIGNGGAGGLTKAGAGALAVAAGNTFTGASTVAAGVLNIAADTSLGAVPGVAATNLTINAGATLQAGATFALNANRKVVLPSGAALIDTNGSNLTIAGNISGSGLLFKIGAGNLTLTGGNSATATGGIAIEAGTVFINNAGDLPGGTITLDGISGISTGSAAANFNNVVVNGTNMIAKTGTSAILGLGAATGSGELTLSSAFTTDLTGSLTGFNGTIVASGVGFRLNGTAGGTNLTLNLGALGASVRNLPAGQAGQAVITVGQLLGTGGTLGGGNVFTGNATYVIGGKTVGGNPVDSSFGGQIANLNSPTVSLTKVGNGTLTLSGTNTYTGTTTVDGGILAITAGTTGAAAGNVLVAPANADTATVTVATGATLNAALFLIGANAAATTGGNGTVTQTGGTINAAQWFSVGEVGTGTFNMSGGILNVNSATGTNLEVATFGTSSGTVSISGASQVNLLNNGGIKMGAQNTTGNGTVTQTGGTVTFYSDAGITVGGTGALTLGAVGTGTYTYNLDGGTLFVPSVIHTTGTGVFNFNGGSLKAAGSTATFMQGLTAANVRSGGAHIDTNGFDVTIAQPITHDPALGVTLDGGLAKSGAGTLALTAVNTYTGTTLLTGGTLNVNADTALGDAGAGVAITNGAVLQAGGPLGTNTRTFALGGVLGGKIDTNGNAVLLAAGSTVTGTVLTKTGLGALTLAGTQTYATLNANNGTTNVNSALGTGSSTINANATVNINASQTLAALNIAAGVEVTFGDGLALVGGAEKFGAAALVPEPGSMGLLLVGALGFLGRRRRS